MSLFTMKEVRLKIGDLKGWELSDNMIQKKYIFKTFKESISFVNKTAALAESLDHHPNITINYNRVLLQLSTHSEGGITDKDFNLAEMIDRSDNAPG